MNHQARKLARQFLAVQLGIKIWRSKTNPGYLQFSLRTEGDLNAMTSIFSDLQHPDAKFVKESKGDSLHYDVGAADEDVWEFKGKKYREISSWTGEIWWENRRKGVEVFVRRDPLKINPMVFKVKITSRADSSKRLETTISRKWSRKVDVKEMVTQTLREFIQKYGDTKPPPEPEPEKGKRFTFYKVKITAVEPFSNPATPNYNYLIRGTDHRGRSVIWLDRSNWEWRVGNTLDIEGQVMGQGNKEPFTGAWVLDRVMKG